MYVLFVITDKNEKTKGYNQHDMTYRQMAFGNEKNMFYWMK